MYIVPVLENYEYKQVFYNKFNYQRVISFCSKPILFADAEQMIYSDDLDSIKNLPDLHIMNKKQDTLLHTATRCKKSDIVRFLLNKKLDPNKKNSHGKTPFLIACSRESLPLVEIFIPYNVDINTRDNLNNTPLHHAKKSPEIIEFLLKHKADPYIMNDFGETPFTDAYPDINILKLYLGHCINPNSVNQNNQTLLHKAVINNNLEVADLLKEYHADINYRDKLRRPPIFYAKYPKTLNWLIKNDAKINISDKDGRTPLHINVINNNLTNSSILLKNSADPNQPDNKKLQPLAYAKSIEMIELLLHYGANPDTVLQNGLWLLNYYAKQNNLEAVYYLTEYKANPNLVDENGNIPYDVTTNDDIKNLLLAAGSNPNFKCYLKDALKSHKFELFANLLECGANPDKPDNLGNTSVFYINNEQELDELEKYHANLNFYNLKGYTPSLHFAMLGNKKMVNLLKKKGAYNLNSLNNETLQDCYNKYEKYHSWITPDAGKIAFTGKPYYEYGTDTLRENLNYKLKLTKDDLNNIIIHSSSTDEGLLKAYNALAEEEKMIQTAISSLHPVIRHFNTLIKEDIYKTASKNPSGSKLPIIGYAKQINDTVFTDNFINKIKIEADDIKSQYDDIVDHYYYRNITDMVNRYIELNDYLAEGIKYVNYVKGDSNRRNKILGNLVTRKSNCLKLANKCERNVKAYKVKYERITDKIVELQENRQNRRTGRKTVVKILTLGMAD